MDGISRATANGGGVAAAVDEEMGGDGMQCSDHPKANNGASGSGICAFCLQEKLGKLVSASSTSFFIGSSSSSSPSFRSDPSAAGAGGGFNGGGFGSSAAVAAPSSSSANGNCQPDSGFCSTTKTVHNRRAHMPFLLTHKKKKKPLSEHHNHPSLVLKRSKSTATPRRRGGNPHLPSDVGEDNYNAHQKRGGFWSFFYSHRSRSEKPINTTSGGLKPASSAPAPAALETVAVRSLSSISNGKQNVDVAPAASGGSSTTGSKRAEYVVVVEENADSPNSSSSNATSFGRKVSRSRSVGCGSRSFSGDFFERISTGFGDCTLRRVESQREGKRSSTSSVRGGAGDVIKERVRCGGIFSGFMMTSSSSYSSSSSYRLAAPTLVHGRSKSWGWTFASPVRVFGKSSSSSTSKEGKTTASKSNPTPNLSAIPSLLAARG